MGRPAGTPRRKSTRNLKEKVVEESSSSKQKKDNKLNKKENLKVLLRKLEDILPQPTENNETKRDSTDVVERAAKYITELENELGPETIALLHSNPEFYKLFSRK